MMEKPSFRLQLAKRDDGRNGLGTMIKRGGPPTSERIDINYLDGPPKPWTAEHELELPEFLQDPC